MIHSWMRISNLKFTTKGLKTAILRSLPGSPPKLEKIIIWFAFNFLTVKNKQFNQQAKPNVTSY